MVVYRRHADGESLVQLCRRGLRGDANCAANCSCSASPVRHDDDPVYSKKWRAAIFLVIDSVLDAPKRWPQQERSEHAEWTPGQFLAQKSKGELADAFRELDNNVADKPVAHDHIGHASRNVL